MVISVDTGNKMIKTEHYEFNSGIDVLDTIPGENDEVIEFGGKYYRTTNRRISYMEDKTEDDRYYILTLIAIAKELDTMKKEAVLAPNELIEIELLVGLPPAHYGKYRKKFQQYFQRDGKVVGFKYGGTSYQILIHEVKVYKGHEFARACNNIGGEFIQISPSSSNCINIMEIRPTDMETRDLLDGYTSERSELASKIQSLHIFFSLLIPDMSHEEKQLLDGAMVTCYQEKGITHDNLSLTDPEHPGKYKKMPILGDLHEVLMRKEECRRMANILNRLVSGSASSFNQQTNVDLENKYVVLDISELSGDLLLGMFVALDFVWTKTKEDRTVEKAVFVDEAWKLLMSNDLAGEYLIEIFKTIRAYGGSAICATQDLADCFAVRDGKLGRGILSNSKTKIVLNMEVSEAERIQEELDLSEAETNSIIHFERGNGLISTNNNNLIVEFKASALEKDLITTDRKDLQELKDRIRKYGTDAYGRK